MIILKKTLNNIEINQTVTVKEINIENPMKRRLFDLGIIEGTSVKCILKSPQKDPNAYLIKGTVIALRSDITSKILVE